jgi:hypothetical protein
MDNSTSLFKRILLAEKLARMQSSDNFSKAQFRSPVFTKQNEYLEARKTHRFRALNCSRRSGKTEGDIIDDLEIGRDFPASRMVRMGLTFDSIMEIGWEVAINKLEEQKIKFTTNETKGLIRLPNKSRIKFFGADAKPREMKKVLGTKLRKVSIDEKGSMTIDSTALCYQMIMPALADNRPNSWLSLLGTCENIPNTFFQKVVEGKETFVPWLVRRWTAYDNPYMVKQWTAEVNDLIKANPDVVKTSWFKTHYLNEWCTDDNLLIIPHAQLKNIVFDKEVYKSPVYILGVDLGFNDDCSFSVLAYSHAVGKLCIVETFKQPELDITATANVIKQLENKYPFAWRIIDGANKQAVEEIQNRHKIQLEAAEKTDKADFLRLLADDIKCGLVEADHENCAALLGEWQSLIWEDELQKKEHPKCANHCSDSVLYAWRKAKHYFKIDDTPKPKSGTDEYMKQLEKVEQQELAEKEREEQEWDEWN